MEEEEESDGQNVPTPPDSPAPGVGPPELLEYDGRIIPDIDIYAIPSHQSKTIVVILD